MASSDTPSTRSTAAPPAARSHVGTATAAPAAPARPGADPARQAYVVLRSAFVLAPVVVGLDKFTNWLVQWDQYLAPALSDPLPVSAQQAMYVVGVIEVLAGIVVALHARLGALVVAAWLAGIIANLLLIPGYYDVAVRDLGLLLSAIALQRLARRYDHRSLTWPLHRG